MNYRGKKDIRVYNECPFSVNLVGQRRDYIFPPCVDGEPTMNFVDFEEIEYAHSRGKVFTIGLLTFAEEDREGMYAALGVKNWQDSVWMNDQIEDMIMHPTMDKMQKIISIRDIVTMERVRGMMVRFMNEKRDVSQNVINIINARFRELNAGNYNTNIEIRPADVETKVPSSEVEDLKRQIAEMKELMANMAKAAEYAQHKDTQKSESEEPTEADKEYVVPVKKTGRKTAAKK